MKKKYAFVIMSTVDPDEVPMPKVFTSAKKAAEHLVGMIDGHGLMNEASEELDMEDVVAWRGPDDLEVWDTDGRVCFTLGRVEMDP